MGRYQFFKNRYDTEISISICDILQPSANIHRYTLQFLFNRPIFKALLQVRVEWSPKINLLRELTWQFFDMPDNYNYYYCMER